jgi:acyl carrier protein
MWSPEVGGMTSQLAEVDLQRLNRAGTLPLSGQHGLALLDEALGRAEPVLVPVRLDLAVLRSRDEDVPAILGGLVRRPVRRAASTVDAGADLTLQQRLAPLGRIARDQLLTALVCDHVAAVLGHSSRAAVDPQRPFKELGFDSLTAVELRNRLGAVADVRLPATLIFDHPTPSAVVDLIRVELTGEDEQEPEPLEAELARLESLVDSTDEATRQRVAARLRTLAAAWSQRPGPADEETGQTDLAAATADDLFDILDSELETFS